VTGFSTAGLGVIRGTGGDVDQVVRKTAWEKAHEGGVIGQDPGSLVYAARHADGSLAASAYGDLGALMGKLDQVEAEGRCPVHPPPPGGVPLTSSPA